MQQELINQGLLGDLEPISLKGLDSVKLLNRVDRKYIVSVSDLTQVFQLLIENQYSVLEIDGHRAFSYQTIYFDTTDYRFYRDHHNRLSSRIKVRTRTYKENNLHFFEIKMKSNVRTNKLREGLSQPGNILSSTQRNKITSIYQKKIESALNPALINNFTRITLVNKHKTERCTIDVNVAFRNPESPENEISLPGIAIIEVKQSKTSLLNGIVVSLRAMRVSPSSISKYVLGLILIHPEIKYNSFKPLLQKINKIQKQTLSLT
ncbi:MAG: polyphosphate polymerase domain-containing protein [Bacteroidetes bacterium]|nr:polyphosphate polymerase domain-containing protein [Bacteroidota bacterium]